MVECERSVDSEKKNTPDKLLVHKPIFNFLKISFLWHEINKKGMQENGSHNSDTTEKINWQIPFGIEK